MAREAMLGRFSQICHCPGTAASPMQGLSARGSKDSLPEWSKGVGSSSTSASCAGSNPTTVTYFVFLLASSCGNPIAYGCSEPNGNKMTAVGFEPTPLRTGACSQRLRPLGQTVGCCQASTAIVFFKCIYMTIGA